jgi:branched-chain amino acid transport system permease protein
MSSSEILIQQIITGLLNGSIIALIALGYTMVYGIVEIINFAHGDLFMLGAFLALTMIGVMGVDGSQDVVVHVFPLLSLLLVSGLFCGTLNYLIYIFAYKHLKNSSKLAPLVSAIGVSFILINIGLFWGGLPIEVFDYGRSASSPKSFPSLVSVDNIIPESTYIFSYRDMIVFLVVLIVLLYLVWLVKYTNFGKAMRGVAQDMKAAELVGLNVYKVIGTTFFIGGFLAGVASVIYATFNNTIYFQMGYRVGMDAFIAAVVGGIGSLSGACFGGLIIGVIRALSDQYISITWTNVVVYIALILLLVFRPAGIMGKNGREKV